ncbi:phosphohexomutase domain-containing protein [Neomegalonema perideroedes]|uniref:hypothetical protein n=1 Tax=Neomegalonema perideroedes TaxID=217219 RepID=UPI000370D9F7|nr:hypothetical protein [Neomegalonema perideroedes]
MSGLKFGTSGLRGLVVDLTDEACALWTRAFLRHLRAEGALTAGDEVLVGRDLRGSSPRIARACLAAIAAEGLAPVDCGEIPSPALALAAMSRGAPGIMVTGSHIPDDRNGLKFYRAEGEIDKADEAGILARAEFAPTSSASAVAPRAFDALGAYRARYGVLGEGLLSGLTIGVYQHSTVSRDVIAQVLEDLGARVLPFARSEAFIPVDTEALRPEDAALARDFAAAHEIDALVSADGDADRPLIADERGVFLRGDLVGLLTARWLGADLVVTPVTSTSAVEACGFFRAVTRTKVGSPYVVAGMQAAGESRIPVGFEANGGVLLGAPARGLAALPTRDALLPILAVIALAKSEGLKLSQLVARLPARFTASDRLKEIPAEKSGPFLERLKQDPAFAAEFAAGVLAAAGVAPNPVASFDAVDGLRMVLTDGSTLHYRASGNAPELRCYVETSEEAAAQALLAAGLEAAKRRLT